MKIIKGKFTYHANLQSHSGRLSKHRFHDLRHTAATLMLMNGIALIIVSQRLGHSKPSVTLDFYGHYMPGMQKEAAELMDELVTPIPAKWQQIGNSKKDISPKDQILNGKVANFSHKIAT